LSWTPDWLYDFESCASNSWQMERQNHLNCALKHVTAHSMRPPALTTPGPMALPESDGKPQEFGNAGENWENIGWKCGSRVPARRTIHRPTAYGIVAGCRRHSKNFAAGDPQHDELEIQQVSCIAGAAELSR